MSQLKEFVKELEALVRFREEKAAFDFSSSALERVKVQIREASEALASIRAKTEEEGRRREAEALAHADEQAGLAMKAKKDSEDASRLLVEAVTLRETASLKLGELDAREKALSAKEAELQRKTDSLSAALR